MPYINGTDKANLGHITKNFVDAQILNPGHLNYLITQLCLAYINGTKASGYAARYQDYNDVVGALEGAKLEFYRRAVSPYEDAKIEENGDVYEQENE